MEVSVENTGGLARRMTVQVPSERVDQEVSSRLQSMSRTVRLDGFRPGKVPLSVVERKYGKQVRNEVVGQLINTSLQEALSRENIQPAGEPRIESLTSQPGEALEFVATFEVYPELGGSIDCTLQVTRPIVKISEQDITSMFDKLRRQRATWSEVDRKAHKDDQLIIDFEGTIDGKPFTGNKGERMPLVLGSGSMIPGFEEQLEGVSAGDEKTIKVAFPADYPAAEVAGSNAQFSIKVHSVSEMALPEIDDDFARAFGISENGVEGLKQEVAGNMQRELKQLLSTTIKNQVFSGLLEKNPVEVPRTLVEDEISRLKTQQQGQGADAPAPSGIEKNAERRVMLGVLVTEIVKQNRIQLDPDRVRKAVDSIAASYEKPEEVVQWYYGNQEMLAGIQSTVIEDQVVEWVMGQDSVRIEDKPLSFDELVEEAKQSKG